MKGIVARTLVLLLVFTWVLISLVTQHNWEIAYEGKFWAETVFLDYGRMRYNPNSPVHIIVGYDSENCVIEAPPWNNLIALVNIKVNVPNSTAAIHLSAPVK